MPQLQADFGGRMVVYEFNYALPRVPLCSIPQAGAAGSNPGFRRNTGHFRVDETRSTGCPMEVPMLSGYGALYCPDFPSLIK